MLQKNELYIYPGSAELSPKLYYATCYYRSKYQMLYKPIQYDCVKKVNVSLKTKLNALEKCDKNEGFFLDAELKVRMRNYRVEQILRI